MRLHFKAFILLCLRSSNPLDWRCCLVPVALAAFPSLSLSFYLSRSALRSARCHSKRWSLKITLVFKCNSYYHHFTCQTRPYCCWTGLCAHPWKSLLLRLDGITWGIIVGNAVFAILNLNSLNESLRIRNTLKKKIANLQKPYLFLQTRNKFHLRS